MIYILLALTTLITSLVSGILSMAGGMILMGVFGFFLSIPAAMVLHGIAQAVSNGARAWIYRAHVRWSVLLPYSLGSLVILILFITLTLIPNKGLVFLLIGSFPFIALAIPKRLNLDMEHKPVAFMSGLFVTTAQMLAGASGPVLDLFYVQSSLSRHQILATKAITQTLGHVIKLVYYAFFLGISTSFPGWLLPAVVSMAIIGNFLATWVVARMDDAQFKTIGRYVILTIGLIYIIKGLIEISPFD